MVKSNNQNDRISSILNMYLGSDTVTTGSTITRPEESDWEREFRESMENIGNAVGNIIPDLNISLQSTMLATADLVKPIFGDKTEDEIDDWMIGQYKKIEDLQSKRHDTGEGIFKGAKQGDVSDVIGGIANAFTGVTTTLIPAIFTRGLSIYPQIMAPMITDYNVEKAKHLYGDDPDRMKKLIEDDETDFVLPAIVGFAAARMEKFGLKGITSYIAKNATKGRGAAMLLTTGLSEGGTEWAQFAAETTNKRLAQGAGVVEATWDGFVSMASDEGVESALQGFVGGSGVAGGGRIVNRALRNDSGGQKLVAASLRNLSKLNIKRGFAKKGSAEMDALDVEIKAVEDNLRTYLLDNQKIGSLLDNEQKTELQDLIIEKDKIRNTLKGLKSDFNAGKITQQSYGGRVKGVVARYSQINDRIAKIKSEVDTTQYETQKQAVEEGAEKAGQQVKELKPDEKLKMMEEQGMVDDIMKEDDVETREQAREIAKKKIAGIYNAKDKTIYIDKDTALEVGEINVAGHELLHPVLNKLIGDDAAQGKIVEDFKKQLTQEDLATMEVEMASRGYGINSGKYNTEYINVFSDSITKNKVKFNESMYSKVGDVIAGVFQGIGFKNIHFKDGRGVHNFLKAYHEGLDTGKFDQDVTTFLEKSKGMKDKLAGKGQLSRATPLEEINTLVPNTIKTKADYTAFISDPKNNAKIFESIYNPGGVINNYIRSRQTSQQEGDKTIENTIDRILNFNPETKRADGSAVGIEGFGESIFANTRFAKLDARKDLAIETERQKMEGGDMEVATKVVAQEKADDTLDKPKAKTKPTQVKSDPTKFDGVPKNLSLKSKPDTNLNVKEIDKKYTGEVGEQIFNIPSNKITKPANNLTLQEARTIQQFFGKSDNLNRFIKILTEYNVATNVTQVGLEKLDVPKNIKGVSLGITKTIQDLFYENYVDPKGEMTSPTGRSKGLKSQTPVKRLKPEFRGTITKETLDKVRSKIGITPTGELNVLPKGAERSSIGQSLKGMAKLFSQLAATTLVRKASPKATAKELIPSKAGLRDAQFSRGVRKQFDLKLKGRLKVDTLLTDNGLDKSLNFKEEIKTPEGRKGIVKMLKDNVVTLGPKEMWIGSRDGNVFTTSGKDYGISMSAIIERGPNKGKPNPNYDAKKAEALTELRSMINKMLNDKKTKFGPPIKGVDNYTLSSYGTIFKGNTKDIKTKSKKFNKKIGLIHKALWTRINKQISKDKKSASGIAAYLKLTANHTGHWHKLGAQISGYSPNIKGTKYEYEHAMPATAAYLYLLDAALTKGRPFAKSYKLVIDNYKLIALDNIDNKKLGDAKLARTMPDGWDILKNKWWERYFNEAVAKQNGGIDPNSIIDLDGNSFATALNIDHEGNKINNNAIKNLIKAKTHNRKILPKGTGGHLSVAGQIKKMQTIDKAHQLSRSHKAPRKGMSVIDFDDTLAISDSRVIVEMKDGEVLKWTPAEFAQHAETVADMVRSYDFSEFNNVKKGKKGPFFNKAKALKKKFGNNDIFILTARPAGASPAIAAFLKGVGLDIKVENIIGLENGHPQAKADWITEKAADGYNDILFADDQIKNVKAVKNALDVIDVKGKYYEAKTQFSKAASSEFNKMLERTKGVAAKKKYSKAGAKHAAPTPNWFMRNIFDNPGSEDFKGLLYNFIGKGKQGDADMGFFKKYLIDPFARAYVSMNEGNVKLNSDINTLNKELPHIKKDLYKETSHREYTNEQAIRVYLWDKNGIKIPGISKTDQKALSKIVNDNADMKSYANRMAQATKLKEGYVPPSENWLDEGINLDMFKVYDQVKRKEYLQEFTENKDLIFSEENLNKIEATYGTGFVDALRDMLRRMETGRNQPMGKDKELTAMQKFMHGAVGATMFINVRSAMLQLISATNFLNMRDNNPLAAAAAFANQPQFWKDVTRIWNSNMLKSRRSGKGRDINEAEILSWQAKSKSLSNLRDKMLQWGFKPTQIFDSIAIAFGGATFYRTKVNALMKKGMSKADAEKKAFDRFREVSEEAQQSSRPDLISQHQATSFGKFLLAFGNTPMQYMRLTKKALADLVKGRGDAKTNVGKIVYYTFVQNLIFNALQSAYWLVDSEDDEKDDARREYAVKNMIESLAKGLGLGGVYAVTTAKVLNQLTREKGWSGFESAEVALSMSPPLSTKIRGMRQVQRNLDKLKNKEGSFDLGKDGWKDGTIIEAAGEALAVVNVPVVKKVNQYLLGPNSALQTELNNELTKTERALLLLGYRHWNLDIEGENKKSSDSGSGKKDNENINPIIKRRLEQRKKKRK